jgi:putative ABC transport system ATP-binding protein
MLQFDDVSRIYRTNRGEVRALDGLSLTVDEGEFVAVRGPSGSGKTTLLFAAGGMQRPSGGRVIVDGTDLYDLPPSGRAVFRAERIGFVFQMFHLVPYLSVIENVLLSAGGDPSDRKTHAGELLERLGLADRMTHRPSELSAGERQRVAIARAVLNRPRLILADEPTGNLDPENAEAVINALTEFHKEGATIIVVTHGQDAEERATRVVRLRGGKLDESE